MKERKTKVTFFVTLVLLFVGFIGSVAVSDRRRQDQRPGDLI